MAPFDSDSYSAVFGGQNRAPAQIDYVAYTITADIHTMWPFLAEDGAFIAPAKLDIIATVANLKVFMPDASIASVGQDCLVRNQGSIPFTVVDFDGHTIINIIPGTSWLIWITDDDSVDGVWAQVQFGASTSSANATALAGAGLRANITKLDQDLLTTPLLGNHIIGLGDRALVLQNNGGVVSYTVDPLVPPVNGFFVYLINAGSGSMTVTPPGGVTIDGSASKVFSPGENAILFADGSNLHTLGYGRSLVNTVTGTSIAMTGVPSPVTLTAPQIAAQVQNYIGTLTANQILEYGGVVGYWFVHNNTTGPFTVTARTNSLDPGVVIPQGTFSILRSDGTNMNVAFTATTGTVTQVNTTAGELVGGPISTTGTIGLADTTIVPGQYGDAPASGLGATYPIISFDQKGRATLAAEVTLGSAAFLFADGSPGGLPQLDSAGLVPPINGGVPTGAIFDTALPPPPGYVYCFGTLGNTGSGATALAAPAAHNLFVGIWNSYPNTTAPVTPGGRGANAEADWTAGKVIALADMRGRVRVARDNNGPPGTPAANRVTNFSASPDGLTLGAAGGGQAQQAITDITLPVAGSISGGTFGSLGVHVDGATTSGSDVNTNAAGGGSTVASFNHGHTVSADGGTSGSLGVTGNFSGSGSSTFTSRVFVLMDPFSIVNVIIKL